MSLRRAASDSEYSLTDDESVGSDEYYDTDLTESELDEEEEEEEEEQLEQEDGKLQEVVETPQDKGNLHVEGGAGGPTDSGEKGGSERGDGETKLSDEIVGHQNGIEDFDAEGDDEREDVVTVVKTDRGTGEQVRRDKKPAPPYEVPKQGRFYMHDDRLNEEEKPRKAGRLRQRRLFDPDAKLEKESNWTHDGYEALNQGDVGYRGKPRRSRRSKRGEASQSSGKPGKDSSRRVRRSRRGESGKERSETERGERRSKKESSRAIVRGRWATEVGGSSGVQEEDEGRTSHVLVVDKATGRTIKKEVSIKDGSLRRSIRRNSRSSWASTSKQQATGGEPVTSSKRSRRYLASKGITSTEESFQKPPRSTPTSKPISKSSAPPPPPPPPFTQPQLTSIPQNDQNPPNTSPTNLAKENSGSSGEHSSLNVNAAQFEPHKNKLSVSARPYQPSAMSAGPQQPAHPRPAPVQYVIGAGPPPMPMPPQAFPRPLPVYRNQQQPPYPVQYPVQAFPPGGVPVFYEGVGQQPYLDQGYINAAGYQGVNVNGRPYANGNRRHSNWMQKQQAGET